MKSNSTFSNLLLELSNLSIPKLTSAYEQGKSNFIGSKHS